MECHFDIPCRRAWCSHMQRGQTSLLRWTPLRSLRWSSGPARTPRAGGAASRRHRPDVDVRAPDERRSPRRRDCHASFAMFFFRLGVLSCGPRPNGSGRPAQSCASSPNTGATLALQKRPSVNHFERMDACGHEFVAALHATAPWNGHHQLVKSLQNARASSIDPNRDGNWDAADATVAVSDSRWSAARRARGGRDGVTDLDLEGPQ